MIKQPDSFNKDKLKVKIFKLEEEAGRAAAVYTADRIRSAIGEKGAAGIILATGTSQFSFLEALQTEDIDWKRITVFHLDEYRGISETHPASFRRYLKERILDSVKPGQVHLIRGDAEDLEGEMAAYENLLKDHRVDIACIGIGENGHIAFNDPPVADFNDPLWVREVELDKQCRMQQLGEGWFPSLEDVPEKAVTLTVTAIMNCKAISCLVPGRRKATAVRNTLYAGINEACPATILRTHPDAILFLDIMSAGELSGKFQGS